MKLLVTDLDNTLYDWVTFFSASFAALLSALQKRLDVSEDLLLSEFKQVHQLHHNSEHPFAACELPSVLAHFPGKTRAQIAEELSPDVFHAFNSARNRLLRLYPGVRETLQTLRQNGVRIVGHTEAIVPNALFRLQKLEILSLLDRLYAIDADLEPHPLNTIDTSSTLAADFVRRVAKEERKPNPVLLLDICRRENVAPSDTVYVGDSVARDIMMAKDAGVVSVWARYGTAYDRAAWDLLVKVTHWTNEDVTREAELRSAAKHISPDHTIDTFAELLTLGGGDVRAGSAAQSIVPSSA